MIFGSQWTIKGPPNGSGSGPVQVRDEVRIVTVWLDNSQMGGGFRPKECPP